MGAFNVYSLEGVRAVVSAAEAERSPAILQVRRHPVVLALLQCPRCQAKRECLWARTGLDGLLACAGIVWAHAWGHVLACQRMKRATRVATNPWR